ncbi:hypothetical protein BDN72DRAFT_262380 [Pluteus cervinus]|uniref:Uncharacterized protein n=1 Tax=Pluteus cervinus TaxID=181527 RepID=A0ACD3AG02_9AGAR|nr:hypothetical protein BDN72DRAFT_262380 [Pluteus cervinus]
MVNFTILAGGFSTFIASYVFDPDASTLTLVKQTETGTNPSWIASHPQNTSILYAVNEIGPVGNLQSFIVQPDTSLTLIDTITTGGNGPTFTNPLSTGEVSAMNFGSPNSSFIATDPQDPTRFIQSPVVDFPVGDGPSNPHMSLEFNGEIFVPDLGADKIWRLVNDGQPGVFRVQGQIDVDPGTGPRHIAIHDNILFTVHETTSTLTAQPIPEAPNGTTLPLIANVSIIPSDQPAGAKFAGAELLISTPTTDFPTPLIYVSNRNIATNASSLDPRGDSIAIYEFRNSSTVGVPPTVSNAASSTAAEPEPSTSVVGSLASAVRAAGSRKRMMEAFLERRQTVSNKPAFILQNQVFTGLEQIRSMSLGRVVDGGDEFLIAGANVAGGVVMYRRVQGGRNLTEVARNVDVQNRTSFVFV